MRHCNSHRDALVENYALILTVKKLREISHSCQKFF